MTVPRDELERRVHDVVASALDVAPEQVHMHSSLINDLGAESIDFIDIVYRLESAFAIEIDHEEIWRGSIDAADEAGIAAGIAALKARMPDFRWDAFPATPTRADLPALVTVRTIVEFIDQRVNGSAPV